MNYEEAPGLCDQLRELVKADRDSARTKQRVDSILSYIAHEHDPGSRIDDKVAEVRDGFDAWFRMRERDVPNADEEASVEWVIRTIGRLEYALGTQYLPGSAALGSSVHSQAKGRATTRQF
jgi:hypothetical protein